MWFERNLFVIGSGVSCFKVIMEELSSALLLSRLDKENPYLVISSFTVKATKLY